MTNTETAAETIHDAAAYLAKIADEWATGASTSFDALQALKVATWKVERGMHALVNESRSNGITWAEIGEALGTSRQAAHERFNQ